MIDLLKRLFGKGRAEATQWAQPQREALIDLLLLGMYADNTLSLAEHDFLESEIDRLEWESPTPCMTYLSMAIHRVRQTEGNADKRAALITSINERLAEASAKQGALVVLKALFVSDGTSPEEQALLQELQNVFAM